MFISRLSSAVVGVAHTQQANAYSEVHGQVLVVSAAILHPLNVSVVSSSASGDEFTSNELAPCGVSLRHPVSALSLFGSFASSQVWNKLVVIRGRSFSRCLLGDFQPSHHYSMAAVLLVCLWVRGDRFGKWSQALQVSRGGGWWTHCNGRVPVFTYDCNRETGKRETLAKWCVGFSVSATAFVSMCSYQCGRTLPVYERVW